MVDKKIALLFPGQGAQYVGMGRDLWDRYDSVKTLFSKASDISGKDLKELLFYGTEEDLKATDNTQLAVTLVNLAVRTCLQEEGIESVCSAGVSLGEYSAMADAGILSEEHVFQLVARRGEIMSRTGSEVIASLGEVGMGAVIGLDFETVARVIADSGVEHVYAANNNSPVQVVVSGLASAIASVQDRLKEAGARRVIPLKVSGPFHTPLLKGGKEALSEALSTVEFRDPRKDFYSNVTGTLVATGAEARELCVEQMVSPVQWLVIERNIGSAGVDFAAESGPGSVLTGLWKKSGMEQACFPCGKAEEIDSFREALKG